MKSLRTQDYVRGASLWAFSLQYYVVQIAVAHFWPQDHAYSWANNTISDLGNTHCGLYGTRYVCSSGHILMNLSFIVLGLTMIGGALSLGRWLAPNKMGVLGVGCMVLAGIGTILVGIFPENTISTLHITGAALSFILGNLGMVIFGLVLRNLPPALRAFTVLSGVVGLAALLLFRTHTYAGIGLGGMERFAGYPQSIWMTVFGTYLLIVWYRDRKLLKI